MGCPWYVVVETRVPLVAEDTNGTLTSSSLAGPEYAAQVRPGEADLDLARVNGPSVTAGDASGSTAAVGDLLCRACRHTVLSAQQRALLEPVADPD